MIPVSPSDFAHFLAKRTTGVLERSTPGIHSRDGEACPASLGIAVPGGFAPAAQEDSSGWLSCPEASRWVNRTGHRSTPYRTCCRAGANAEPRLAIHQGRLPPSRWPWINCSARASVFAALAGTALGRDTWTWELEAPLSATSGPWFGTAQGTGGKGESLVAPSSFGEESSPEFSGSRALTGRVDGAIRSRAMPALVAWARCQVAPLLGTIGTSAASTLGTRSRSTMTAVVPPSASRSRTSSATWASRAVWSRRLPRPLLTRWSQARRNSSAVAARGGDRRSRRSRSVRRTSSQ
jgi:hypothetical protein